MGQELIKRTNKAELYRLPDGSVLKRYFTNHAVERAMQDQRSLLYIQEKFGLVYHEGWLYRAVKFLWLAPDRCSLCMEFAPGRALPEVPKSKIKEAEYHCGVWMALYHNKVLDGATEGLIYADCGVRNFIVNFEQKSVTAMDPGGAWGRSGYVYEDLVRHIDSVLFVLVARGKAPVSAIMSFLKGYRLVKKAKLSLFHYYKGLYRELRRQFIAYATKSYVKCLLFSVVIVSFFPFYLLLIPGYLFFSGVEGSTDA